MLTNLKNETDRTIPSDRVLPLTRYPYITLPHPSPRSSAPAARPHWSAGKDQLEGCRWNRLLFRRVLLGRDRYRLWIGRGLELDQLDLGFDVSDSLAIRPFVS
jgi:hypothetical protein